MVATGKSSSGLGSRVASARDEAFNYKISSYGTQPCRHWLLGHAVFVHTIANAVPATHCTLQPTTTMHLCILQWPAQHIAMHQYDWAAVVHVFDSGSGCWPSTTEIWSVARLSTCLLRSDVITPFPLLEQPVAGTPTAQTVVPLFVL
jgi:hypothetical protein